MKIKIERYKWGKEVNYYLGFLSLKIISRYHEILGIKKPTMLVSLNNERAGVGLGFVSSREGFEAEAGVNERWSSSLLHLRLFYF
jgi:hypothetical protein